MSNYKIIHEDYTAFISGMVDGTASREARREAIRSAYHHFEGVIQGYIEQGYSVGTVTDNFPVVSQMIYKIPKPFVNNKLALGSIQGGRRITNSSRLRRGRRHSASRTRKARSMRRSRSQK